MLERGVRDRRATPVEACLRPGRAIRSKICAQQVHGVQHDMYTAGRQTGGCTAEENLFIFEKRVFDENLQKTCIDRSEPSVMILLLAQRWIRIVLPGHNGSAWHRPVHDGKGSSTIEWLMNDKFGPRPESQFLHWDTASRGLTTLRDSDTHFRTYPSGHGKTSINITHDLLGITDCACKNHLVMVSVQYSPFSSNILIETMTIGKSRVSRDSIDKHKSCRSNSDIAYDTRTIGESLITKHRFLHASGPHPIPPSDDPNGVVKWVKQSLRGVQHGQICLCGSPAVLTVSVVKKRCISRSAKQKMQSAVASIHQFQAISCCKQKSIPAVDTTDGSAGVTGPAGAQRTISWKQMRAVSWKQMRAVSCKQMSTRSDAKEESESDVEQLIQMSSTKEKINQTFHEEKMKQLVRKDVNNSGVESAVEEVNEPDAVVQLLTYHMLINRGESAVGTTNSCEDDCTNLGRRKIGLDKCRRDLNLLSNGHSWREAIYTARYDEEKC
ncbi:hypothetical protein F511_07979 [Dorcoceras hygrometricum]|uniref:Uncharacterized protein n=1 Tax=Dorcoceras hygrometricum TaxID=472368 RepID=A0A2Z7BWL0_9LAMI|nr:hypothetical protein F511_07979 [Dorcoceras hygrometricum]